MMNKYPGLLAMFFAVFMISCNSNPKSETAESTTNDGDKIVNQAPAPKAVNTSNALTDGYQVGDTADDFNLKGTDDQEHSLSEFTDVKGFIITFTCNTCPYAVMYEDRLIELHNKYAEMGYPVVAINPNDPEVKPGDSYDQMKVRANEKSFPFLYLFDEGQKVYPKFGASRTPHVFLLNNELTVKYIGAIDDNPRDASAVKTKYLEDAINAVDAGKDPDPNFTKAIGCSIKTKKS